MDKKLELRKFKSLATGLFVLMALLYIAMLYTISVNAQAWMYYVKAFSEAAMVGALADWFAVTALFRYPMGIKIPHTNLIESSKDKIGENLGDFVTDNFLTPASIRPYIEDLEVSKYLISWLEKANSISILSNEATTMLNTLIKSIDREVVVEFVHSHLRSNLSKIPFNSLLSKSVQIALENKEQDKLLNAIIPEIRSYILTNDLLIYNRIVEKQPILGLIGGKSITNQLVSGLNTFLLELEEDLDHPIRKELVDKIRLWSEDVAEDPDWQNRILGIVSNYMNPEVTQAYISDVWLFITSELEADLTKEDSFVRKSISSGLTKIISDFKANIAFQNRLNNWVQSKLYKLILGNTKELGNLIERTVSNWDGKELSNKLELEVGKDLQFIRVNGTLVGGVVGLIIYTITEFLF